MKNKNITIETAVYLTVFMLALGLRIGQLGTTPLSELEATNAVQAVNIASGNFVVVGENFFYILATAFIFAMGKSTEFAARLLPAIIGSGIVFAPMLVRDK